VVTDMNEFWDNVALGGCISVYPTLAPVEAQLVPICRPGSWNLIRSG
jgi:hypothetical protein